MPIDAVILKETDNVATSLRDAKRGETVSVRLGKALRDIVLQEDISYGHKFAVRDIRAGDSILKYGETIGRATEDIPSGRHAHIHNIESLRGRGDLA